MFTTQNGNGDEESVNDTTGASAVHGDELAAICPNAQLQRVTISSKKQYGQRHYQVSPV